MRACRELVTSFLYQSLTKHVHLSWCSLSSCSWTWGIIVSDQSVRRLYSSILLFEFIIKRFRRNCASLNTLSETFTRSTHLTGSILVDFYIWPIWLVWKKKTFANNVTKLPPPKLSHCLRYMKLVYRVCVQFNGIGRNEIYLNLALQKFDILNCLF